MSWYLTTCLLLLVSSTARVALAAEGAKNGMGVDYGVLGDNLPPPSKVIPLLQKCGIQQIRIYDPNTQVLDALASISDGNNILVSIGVKNEDLPGLAGSLDTAKDWVKTNYASYYQRIRIVQIIVGNEVVPGENARYLVQAMRNLRTALDDGGIVPGDVVVTTALSTVILNNTFPPSQSTFTPDAMGVMTDLLAFQQSLPLGRKGSIIIHLYPYFAYAADPANVPLDFAMFEAKTPRFSDGNLPYYNLFDSMYDGFVWAMEKIGGANETVFDIGETGWPSAGNGDFTTPELAQRYNTNLYNHITSGVGSPKNPHGIRTALLFSLFNEDQKPAGIEQNWGLFHADMSPVYTTPFCQQQ